MADTIFGHTEPESWNIPIVELPVLLDPFDKFIGDKEKTVREYAARLIYYTHFKTFEKEILNGTEVGSIPNILRRKSNIIFFLNCDT